MLLTKAPVWFHPMAGFALFLSRLAPIVNLEIPTRLHNVGDFFGRVHLK